MKYLTRHQRYLVYVIVALIMLGFGRIVSLVSPEYQSSLEFQQPDLNTGRSMGAGN